MQQANISIRVDKIIKDKFCDLCDDFGLTTTAAFNLFMKAVIREKKIPFEISVSENKESGLNAFRQMREIASKSGLKEPSLEEINAQIKSVRDAIR